jgi:Flp pilus assembly protein TadD
MKRFAYSLFIGMFCALVLTIAACGSQNPRMELTSYIDKIVSILKAHQNNAGQAAAALKDFVRDNLDRIGSLVAEIKKQSGSAEADQELDSAMIFEHTRLIDSLDQLEKNDPGLMNDPQVAEALKPLFEVFK